MSYRASRDTKLVHTWPAPGSWAFIRGSDQTKEPTAWVCCPDCGQAASLADHRINALGKVSPSLDCPTADCKWHVVVVLDGWAEAIAP